MEPKPDFRHVIWALLAKLQTEGRGNEFSHVLRSKVLQVLEFNLKAIAVRDMPASRLRWEIYREMSNHFWGGNIPRYADLFKDTPLPEDGTTFDIHSMDEKTTAETTDGELVAILWDNGKHQQEEPADRESHASMRRLLEDRLPPAIQALASILQNILSGDTSMDSYPPSREERAQRRNARRAARKERKALRKLGSVPVSYDPVDLAKRGAEIKKEIEKAREERHMELKRKAREVA